MGKWNDTDVPLACLITFRTYGSWLHGDARGSVDRAHNRYGGLKAESRIIREQQQMKKLKSDPFIMNGRSRKVVSAAIMEVCVFRGWPLLAVNVRTNHAHAVVGTAASSGKVLGDLKAYATRKLRLAGCWNFDHSPWVDKGSTRNLWNDDHISSAIEYVTFGQGDELPMFD